MLKNEPSLCFHVFAQTFVSFHVFLFHVFHLFDFCSSANENGNNSRDSEMKHAFSSLDSASEFNQSN